MQMRYVYEYLRRSPLDHALVQVARDREGQMRLGPNADFFDAVRESAKIVVAELNEGFVAAAGAPLVPETSIDYVVETERPLIETSPSKIDPVSEKIGALVAALIGDGDCIQTGIGAIPAAILASLSQHNDLGLHGGLIDDGGMALVRNGNLNGAAKTRDLGIHTTGMAVGSLDLYEWLADTPSVQLAGANITHEISILGSIGHFVSINSAVEVDLEGQVNAEVIAGRQISGTGGSVDFMRAAKASRGGRSIIAMTATAKDDAVSRIVPKVEMVTALRTDVDIVVTEYGVADLRHATRQERRETLIDIAHPDFRATLRDAIA
jgi:4-hydroxybutyrate CoA-transferase